MSKQLKVMLHVTVLVALEVVLSRFCSIATQFGKIGVAFLPLAVCAMLFGPWWSCIAGGLADFIGAILFPIGPYFPGFTLSNALIGLLFGLFLHKRFSGWKHIVPAVLFGNFGVSLFLSTLWLKLLFDSPYLGLLPTRLIQSCIMSVLELVLIPLIQGPMGRYFRQMRL